MTRLAHIWRHPIKSHGVEALDVEPEDYSDRYHLFTTDGAPHPFEELPLARAVGGEHSRRRNLNQFENGAESRQAASSASLDGRVKWLRQRRPRTAAKSSSAIPCQVYREEPDAPS